MYEKILVFHFCIFCRIFMEDNKYKGDEIFRLLEMANEFRINRFSIITYTKIKVKLK